MKWLDNLKVRNKLVIGFGTLVMVSLIVSYYGYSALKYSNESFQTLYNEHFLASVRVGELEADFNGMNALVSSQLLNNKQDAASINAQLTELIKEIDTDFRDEKERLKIVLKDEQEEYMAMSSIINELESLWTSYKQMTMNEIQPLILNNQIQQAHDLIQAKQRPIFDKMVETVGKMLQKEKGEAEGRLKDSSKTFNDSVLIYLLLTAFSIANAVIVTHLISVKIAGRITLIAGQVGELSAGNLTVEQITDNSEDEIGKLIKDVNILANHLKNAISEVVNSSIYVKGLSGKVLDLANVVNDSSKQVSNAITQVAQGISEQGRSASEISSAAVEISDAMESIAKGSQEQADSVNQSMQRIESLSTNINEVVSSVEQGVKVSDQSKSAAETGSRAINRALTGFDSIKTVVEQNKAEIVALKDKSEEIGSIISIIDDIADQTNLLALNAAIEAARAGEYGKGFAVVADEIRKLAHSSSESTQEIANLIRDAQHASNSALSTMTNVSNEINNSSQYASDAFEDLNRLVDSVNETTVYVGNIEKLTHSMRIVSEEALDLIINIATITEENAATNEEVSASSNSVANNISTMAAITEENAAMSEEVSAQSSELESVSNELNNAAVKLSAVSDNLKLKVDLFKVDEEDTSDSTPELNAFERRMVALNAGKLS